jgi:hypothetical protein
MSWVIPASITNQPITMATPIDETMGNAIAKIPKMINRTDNRSEAPVARFNPASSVFIKILPTDQVSRFYRLRTNYGIPAVPATVICDRVENGDMVVSAPGRLPD